MTYTRVGDGSGIRMQCRNSTHLRLLGARDSLWPVLRWMRELQRAHNIANDEVLVALDFDGTISNLLADETRRSRDADRDALLRGGRETRRFFETLERERYRWVVLSARAYDEPQTRDILRSLRDEMRLPFPPWFLAPQPGSGTHAGAQESVRQYVVGDDATGDRYRIVECANLVGAVPEGEAYAFAKDAAMDVSIERLFPRREPRLVVFVDDNSDNVRLLHNHFRSLLLLRQPAPGRDAHFLGVFFYPQVDERLADALLALQLSLAPAAP